MIFSSEIGWTLIDLYLLHFCVIESDLSGACAATTDKNQGCRLTRYRIAFSLSHLLTCIHTIYRAQSTQVNKNITQPKTPTCTNPFSRQS